MEDLTHMQFETLEVIHEIETELGRFPSLSELARTLGLKSRISAYDRIMTLVRKQYIHHYPNNKSGNVFALSRTSRALVSKQVEVDNSSSCPTINIQNTLPITDCERNVHSSGTSGVPDSNVQVGYSSNQYKFSLNNIDSISLVKITIIVGYFTLAGFSFNSSHGSYFASSIFMLSIAPATYYFYNSINKKE